MKKLAPVLLYAGYIAILIAAIIYPSHINFKEINIALPLEVVGAISLITYRVLEPIHTGDQQRDKRLQFQTLISSALLLVTAYLMYCEDHRWLVSLLVAVVIDAIIAFRIPKTNE